MSEPDTRRIGRFDVIATLGAGAMGEVYRARDTRLGREVAIKTVRNIFGVNASLFRTRFEAEARALAALSHPAIVQVHDLGIEGEEPFLVMELVDGPTLKGRLEKGPMPPAEVLAMGIQLARALEAAHARGILHRDVKPANVLLHSNGQWKLADFGVAHVPDSSVTMTGQFLGTPAYAAPEAVALGKFSESSDVFGLAAVLVEALTGERLRGDASLSEIVQHSNENIALPAGVPPELAVPLRAALSRDPATRPRAAAFADLLAGAGSFPPGVASSYAPGMVPVSASPATEVIASRVPTKPRDRRLVYIGAAAGAIILIGLIAAIASSGGGGDDKRGPAASPAAAREPHERESDEPTRIEQPPLDDKHAAKDWNKVLDQVEKGRVEEALEKLEHFEDKYGRSPGTEQLRAYLEQHEED